MPKQFLIVTFVPFNQTSYFRWFAANIGWFVDKKWFSIMPHLSLFSFCDETLVPVIFSGRE